MTSLPRTRAMRQTCTLTCSGDPRSRHTDRCLRPTSPMYSVTRTNHPEPRGKAAVTGNRRGPAKASMPFPWQCRGCVGAGTEDAHAPGSRLCSWQLAHTCALPNRAAQQVQANSPTFGHSSQHPCSWTQWALIQKPNNTSQIAPEHHGVLQFTAEQYSQEGKEKAQGFRLIRTGVVGRRTF